MIYGVEHHLTKLDSLVEEHKDKWAIVAGIEFTNGYWSLCFSYSQWNQHKKLLLIFIKSAREGVKVKPESLEPEECWLKLLQILLQQSNNVGAPGSFEYVLARIDSRLLHGQVATAWTKTVKPTRIIVVSDDVAKDELRKKLIQQAAPPGVKAHTVPVSQMIKLAKDDQHFGGQRALLLFENPEDVLRAVEGGVPIKTVNVGSMAHSPGKVQPNKVLAFNQEDIDTFNKLKEAGLDFDVRKVPNDTKGNMDEILKKAQEELNKLK